MTSRSHPLGGQRFPLFANRIYVLYRGRVLDVVLVEEICDQDDLLGQLWLPHVSA